MNNADNESNNSLTDCSNNPLTNCSNNPLTNCLTDCSNNPLTDCSNNELTNCPKDPVTVCSNNLIDCSNNNLNNNPNDLSNNNLYKLSQAYKDKYGKELMGKQLGQFKNDLKYPNHSNIHSSKCIILGKKCYINMVTGKNNDTGKYECYACPKMAGVNTYAMNEYSDYWNLYERLYDGEVIKFDLAYGDSVIFDFKNTVTTKDSYIKYISFKGTRCQL